LHVAGRVGATAAPQPLFPNPLALRISAERRPPGHVSLVFIPHDNGDGPHVLAFGIAPGLPTGITLWRDELHQVLSLQEALDALAIEMLQAVTRKEYLKVRDLVLAPAFETKRSTVREATFSPTDV